MSVILRPARSTDAGTVGQILHDFSREHDWMPRLYSGAETIAFCGKMIDRGWVTVAEHKGAVIGFLSLTEDEVQSLYVARNMRGQGVGRLLLDHAKAQRDGLSLYAFQANHAAQRFYERNGFVEAARGDGSENDENLPDIRYLWQRQEAEYG